MFQREWVTDTFFVSRLARRLAEFQVEIASEVMVNRAKMYNPAKLEEMRKHLDKPDYPWKSEADNRIFWRTYHEMLDESGKYRQAQNVS